MDKKEYIERRNAINKQLTELNTEYVNTNIAYPVGTKVKVTDSRGKSRIGIVTDNIINDNVVVPYVKQITNSGEVSMRRIVVYQSDKVEVISE